MSVPKTKEELINNLRSHECTVVFKKKDDTVRSMSCTLMEDKLPSKEVSGLSKKPSNENVVPVWDIKKNAWRSFRIDSILDFTVKESTDEQVPQNTG